jgi:hypothetical protein
LFCCEGGTPVYRKSAGSPVFAQPAVPDTAVARRAAEMTLMLKQQKIHTIDTTLTIFWGEICVS